MSRQSSKSFSSCRGYKDVGLGAQQVRRKLTNQISPSVKEIEQDYGRVFSEKDQLIADIRGMQVGAAPLGLHARYRPLPG